MAVYYVAYETLGNTHPGIYTTADMVEYSPSKKVVELESNFSFSQSSIKERSLEPHNMFHTENH